jgi:CO/xanthine dehydrogenase FAD-binding subunit
MGWLKKGGQHCPARTGNHLFGVCFDLGPCVAPHPSTLGMALLAYDAEVEVAGGASRPGLRRCTATARTAATTTSSPSTRS